MLMESLENRNDFIFVLYMVPNSCFTNAVHYILSVIFVWNVYLQTINYCWDHNFFVHLCATHMKDRYNYMLWFNDVRVHTLPWNMHNIMFCFVSLWLYYIYKWLHMSRLHVRFQDLANGTADVTASHEHGHFRNTTKHGPCANSFGGTMINVDCLPDVAFLTFLSNMI